MVGKGKFGLAAIQLAFLAVALGIGWAVFHSFQMVRQIDQFPATFGNITNEYLHIAAHLELSVAELDDLLSRCATRHDPADWESFERQSQNLKSWIEERKSSSPKVKILMIKPVGLTVDVGSLLNEIDVAFSAYLEQVRKIVKISGPQTGPPVTPADLVPAQNMSRRLVALANQARAHAEAIQIFLAGSRDWRSSLRHLMLAVLLLLATLGIGLATVIYQRVVAPLRAKLVESDTIIERQKKLAHFSELAAGVAHEIRNPLMAIRARLYTLQKTLSGGTAAHEDATMIRNEIQRLDRIVTDFLRLARPSEPDLAPMSAAPLLEEVRALFAAPCERQSIKLKLEPAVDARFLGDPQQLKQALINLISNAAESIERQGTITLRARLDTRRLQERESGVVAIEVQDTGGGISAAVQERLFDPFFSTKEGGTGLGLSIVTRIVDKHGGKLEFQTCPDEGSTFSIVLPVFEQRP